MQHVVLTEEVSDKEDGAEKSSYSSKVHVFPPQDCRPPSLPLVIDPIIDTMHMPPEGEEILPHLVCLHAAPTHPMAFSCDEI